MNDPKPQERALLQSDTKKFWVNAVTMMALAILAGFIVQLHRNSSGVIREFLQADFAMTALEFSSFSSMYFYPYVIMQLPMGILSDTLGPRKTIAAGLLICTIGTVLTCTAQSYRMLCLARVIIGVGVSCPVTCSSKLYSNWFASDRVATAQGIGQGLGSLLGMLGQAPLAIVVGLFTWRSVYLALAIGTFAIGALVFFVLKEDPSAVKLPTVAQLERRDLSCREKLRVGSALKNVFFNKWTLPFLLIMPVHMGTYNMFAATWGVSYLTDTYNLTTVQASANTGLLMIGMMAGSILCPWLSDRLKSRKAVLYLVTIESIIAWGMLAFCSEFIARHNLIGVMMIAMGFTQGIICLFFAQLRELNDPRTAGMATGGPNMIGMMGSAIMPIIAGTMIDKRISLGAQGIHLYREVFALCMFLYVFALIVAFFTKETHCKNIYASKGCGR